MISNGHAELEFSSKKYSSPLTGIPLAHPRIILLSLLFSEAGVNNAKIK